MAYYYEMRIETSERSSLYYWKLTREPLDFSRGKPRIENGTVTLSEITKETYSIMVKNIREQPFLKC